MEYFIPDWEDRIDPNFDFENDFKRTQKSDSYKGRVYAHEIFEIVPYDGILISLGLFNKLRSASNGSPPSIRGFTDIKQYLRTNGKSPLKVMGDCGAYSFINQENAPFSVTEVADLYAELNFDFGISLDRLVVKSIINGYGKKVDLTETEREHRRRFSLDNAEHFLKYCQEKRYSFVPIGFRSRFIHGKLHRLCE